MNINVKYQLIDGAHFYTSALGDGPSRGLCVAHNDPRKAFDEVSAQLAYLFKANHSLSVSVTPPDQMPETEGTFTWYVENKEWCLEPPGETP